MLPMEFDYQMLNSLPLASEEGVRRVLNILQSTVAQRVVPFFRNKRGDDLIQLARINQNLSIERWEDDDEQAQLISLVSHTARGWNIRIHERVFDYMVFVTPYRPESVLADGNMEERKIRAFAEFMLRHNFEHLLHPEREEREVINSDVDFAMIWRKDDPTSYRMLRNALSDEMNGIRGADYLELLDNAEHGKSSECIIKRIVSRYVSVLEDLPTGNMDEIFTDLDHHIKIKILGDYYRKSRSTSYSLEKRSSYFQRVLRLFAFLIKYDRNEAMEIFNVMKDRWGLVALFHELELPEGVIEEEDSNKLFEMLSEQLEEFTSSEEPERPSIPARPIYSHLSPEPFQQPPPPAPKTLKERIEEARNSPLIPRPVLELIDRNKQNATGQSGAKYTELIETLLSIPWGTIRKIQVSPTEFEEGLNRSHFGLEKPKEIVCDIFANLIWRYQHFKEEDTRAWQRTGSALLFVGPPGVGKTSLGISIARNLGIPYHKLSLGGMRDEADIRGYGFTYEGSKPGPIVQGLIKMGVMNGMFILDEADKTEKFALATLLEILDPEQNHLFHDKYTQSTIDIDLSNCHFILTANTLETVPSAVVDRCEIIMLSRYSVEEKIAIALKYLIRRVREKYMIGEREIFLDPKEEADLLRFLIRNYTFEAGVRDLERVLRTLFLRVHRKEILARGEPSIAINRERIKDYLEEPSRPPHINEEDRVGEMMALGVNMEVGIGSLIPIQATPVRSGQRDERRDPRRHMSIVHATGNIEKVMDESRKVATTAIFHCAEPLGIDSRIMDDPVHLHFMGGSSKKDGPSAGGAIALALLSFFSNRKIRRDVVMTGEIDTQGRITGIGGLGIKLETAYAAGCKTMIIPKENLQGLGGIQRLPDALKHELQILNYSQWKGPHEPFDYTRHIMQVVAVDHIQQAADIAFIDQEEIDRLEIGFTSHARNALRSMADLRTESVRNLRIVYVNDPDELDTDFLQSGFCSKGYGCVLLAGRRMLHSIESKLAGPRGRITIRAFDAQHETLTDIIKELHYPFLAPSLPPLRISIVAPLSLLQRDAICREDFPPDPNFAGVRLFAGCCTVENIQIKYSRNVINRAFLQFVRLQPHQLEECPFLVIRNGIHMISLSFIPEKYRLDVKRSEEILTRGLTRWLAVMEGESYLSNLEDIDAELERTDYPITA